MKASHVLIGLIFLFILFRLSNPPTLRCHTPQECSQMEDYYDSRTGR